MGVLRWFTSPRSLPQSYVFTLGWQGMTPAGFAHSEIPGSKLICSSPRLIAAYRVLHRLSAPRHPPCTLSSLTKLECILDSTNLSSMSDSVVKEPDGAAHSVPSVLGPDPRAPLPRALPRAASAGATLSRSPRRFPGSKAGSTSLAKNHVPEATQRVVELIGIEPTTSALQGRRSPN